MKGIYTILTRFDRDSCLYILNHPLSKSIDTDYSLDNIINKRGFIIVEYINIGKSVITTYYQTNADNMHDTIDRHVRNFSHYLSNKDCIKALDEVCY